jgi:hypothetical protein
MQRELEPGQRLEDIEESIRAITMRSNADMYSIVILRGFSMDSESFIAMLVNGEGEIVTWLSVEKGVMVQSLCIMKAMQSLLGGY